ncbi:hypothetical protein DCAR_0205436 [Daucus carota subsp. sativus]|uniref:Uncharacterized protein n=1 Tax=Daucus carota subsp. sativus TaxID=79200 RepID=A0AAF1AN77_DAUCS|nr:hypothetical protein DCAR_0205436 [Daucus carota subsp. sativus]
MDERYPVSTPRPHIYQYTQSSTHPSGHTLADYVKAIYKDRELLPTLGEHLRAMDPEELARALAAAQEQEQHGD